MFHEPGTLWKSDEAYRLLWEYCFSIHAIKIYRIEKCTNYIKNSIEILKTQIYNLAICELLY